MPAPKELHDVLDLITTPLRNEIARLEKDLSGLEIIVAENLARLDDSLAELRVDLQAHLDRPHS